GEKLRLYRCRTQRSEGRCPAPASVLGRVVEPYVEEQLFLWLGGVRAEGKALTSDLEAAEKAVAQSESELATYLTAVSAEDLGAEAFSAGAKQRREASDRATEALEQAREQAGLADLPREADLRHEWPNLDVRDRNAIIRQALDGVILSTGRRPINDRSRLIWRGMGEEVQKPDRRQRGHRG
ncbi:MAG: hypothetical protein ABI726_05085, partial [bacterium]